MLNLKVEYPHQVDEIEISDAWLATCISGIRKNLEYGQLLDEEIGGFDRFSIDSILDQIVLTPTHIVCIAVSFSFLSFSIVW